MTLTTIPRYDPGRISTVGDHAVVVGESMAGLLAARVLADGFDDVTVIERDPRPDELGARRGVPQGRHVHLLEEAGRATLEDLFPGYGEELISAGGLMIDMLSDFVAYQKGGVLAEGPTRIPAYFATRPLFERIVRERVTDFDGVCIRHGCQYIDYLADDAATVEGITVKTPDSEQEDSPPIWSSTPPAGRAGHRRGWKVTAMQRPMSTRSGSTWRTARRSSSVRPTIAGRFS